jgi:hypothetical protein
MSTTAVYLTELYIFTGLLLAFAPSVKRNMLKKVWGGELSVFEAVVATTVVVLLMPPAFLVHLVSDR